MYLFFELFFYLQLKLSTANWNTCMICWSVKPIGGGGKTGQEFPYTLEWWSALLRLKKNERSPRDTKLSPQTKSPTSEVWGDAAERGCVISLGYFSTLPKRHNASFEVWFGFTRMEHLNFNSSFETSFSKCVCLVFDCCQFDCSLHINCCFHFHTLIIAVNLLSDKIFNFPSISKSSPWVRLNTSF